MYTGQLKCKSLIFLFDFSPVKFSYSDLSLLWHVMMLGKLTACFMANSQKLSFIAEGQLVIAWSSIVLVVAWIVPMVHSALPFCQWLPTAQNVRRWLAQAMQKVLEE